MTKSKENRIVMTLDAGGTNLKFSAVRGNKLALKPFSVPSNADNLDRCLATIVDGFKKVSDALPAKPVAISFAFPGPADYPNGIIGDLPNLPAFRGGIALGPMLEDVFDIPVFINNDGDLFVYGEAIAGFLPHVNNLLKKAGSPKRYRNLFGVTLGTGFGGGIVRDGDLFIGDNSGAGEIWLLRNKLIPNCNIEDGASIRAVRRVYAEVAGLPAEKAPEPKDIFDIGMGTRRGNRKAAKEAFRRLGETVGDGLGNALTLIDGACVIGGGVSGAWPLFLPAVVDELNSRYTNLKGDTFRRLSPMAFNVEDPAQLEKFLKGEKREIVIPGTKRKIAYDPLTRIPVGMSRLGTSEAVAIGAYAFALHQLDRKM